MIYSFSFGIDAFGRTHMERYAKIASDIFSRRLLRQARSLIGFSRE